MVKYYRMLLIFGKKHGTEDDMEQREKFGSRLGFILVSAGCAVGLGNVWKFPYICGINGGATFILIYLAALILLGLPILICEFAVGRGSGRGPARSYDVLEPQGEKWHLFKWPSITGNYLLMMFYTMVGGWMLRYVYMLGSGNLEGRDQGEIAAAFGEMLEKPWTMTFWMILAVTLSLGVCVIGLEKGIEKITKIMMSLLILLILILVIRSMTLPNAMEGVRFYLVPNGNAIRERGLGPVIFDAMTHAFFTLSIGVGSMQIFGSYLEKDNTLLSESTNVVCLDTFVALMAGLIIIPACFAFGIQPDSGPSLLFITLPNVFNHMSAGRIWGTCFFLFMAFAALSTIIAVFENIIAFYMDQFSWSRKKAVLLNLFLIPVLSLPAVLGFSILSGIQPMGAGSTIMDLEDFLVSYNILPIGSMVYVMFCTRKNGWGWDGFTQETNTGKGKPIPNGLRVYMAYVLPMIITVIYLKGYYDIFEPMGRGALTFWMSFAVVLLAAVFFVVRKRNDHKK